MAAFPGFWSSPAFVTRPTPAPPSIMTVTASVSAARARNAGAALALADVCMTLSFAAACGTSVTVAYTMQPSVTSGSSPASLRMPQQEQCVLVCDELPVLLPTADSCSELPAPLLAAAACIVLPAPVLTPTCGSLSTGTACTSQPLGVRSVTCAGSFPESAVSVAA